MSEGTPTVVTILNEVAVDFCDNYCRWPWEYPAEEDGKLYEEHCENCPINRLEL